MIPPGLQTGPFVPILSPMSYLDDHLLDGERIVYRARLHWTIFLKAIVVVLLGIALGIVLWMYEPNYWYIGAALAGVGLLLAIPPFIRYTSTEYAVTNKRLLSKVGFVERESDETLLSKIEAVAVDQGILGRMLGFGTLTITGTGGTDEGFPRIAHPLEFRRQIQSQVVALEERRQGSGLPAAPQGDSSRVERECPYCAERILARARVCKHCGREVVPVAE
jgi:membrane protein YdbS with pleckstrin-like domain